MAKITLNEAAIQRFLHSDTGPVVRDLARRAQNVTALATLRAAGPVIGIESGALHSGIHYRIEHRASGPVAIISTDAKSSWHGIPFSYPAFHDRTERPWLSGALRAVLD